MPSVFNSLGLKVFVSLSFPCPQLTIDIGAAMQNCRIAISISVSDCRLKSFTAVTLLQHIAQFMLSITSFLKHDLFLTNHTMKGLRLSRLINSLNSYTYKANPRGKQHWNSVSTKARFSGFFAQIYMYQLQVVQMFQAGHYNAHVEISESFLYCYQNNNPQLLENLWFSDKTIFHLFDTTVEFGEIKPSRNPRVWTRLSKAGGLVCHQA